MGVILISLGLVVFLSILLATFVRFFVDRGGLMGLLSDEPHQASKMLRLQYLFLSTLGATTYLIVVLAEKEFLPIPDVLVGLVGLSSAGYLGGKGLQIYRLKRSETK